MDIRRCVLFVTAVVLGVGTAVAAPAAPANPPAKHFEVTVTGSGDEFGWRCDGSSEWSGVAKLPRVGKTSFEGSMSWTATTDDCAAGDACPAPSVSEFTHTFTSRKGTLTFYGYAESTCGVAIPREWTVTGTGAFASVTGSGTLRLERAWPEVVLTLTGTIDWR